MNLNINIVLFSSLVLHFILIKYGEWQDQNFDVKYTDIDYEVFTDAAKFIFNGQSPYLRHTYRYTPILAYLLIPNIVLQKSFGKIIFSFFNVATGYIIYKTHRLLLPDRSVFPVAAAASWIFNPLTFTVSTRGNAESLMTFFVVTFLYLLLSKKYWSAGSIYGFAIHFKLYPAVYALPILLHFTFASQKPVSIRNLVSNILNVKKSTLSFVFSSFLFFLIPTMLSFLLYPNDYYRESLIYHISRKDIRHNFSPYFYMLYLTDQWNSNILGLVLFLPQCVLLLIIALKYSYGNNILFCLFCETFIFVTFNKVCTSQYFLWFLCFLPLIAPYVKMSVMRSIVLLGTWILGQSVWLYFAYRLEFLGENVFFTIWLASLLFFSINCFLLCQFIKCYNIVKFKAK